MVWSVWPSRSICSSSVGLPSSLWLRPEPRPSCSSVCRCSPSSGDFPTQCSVWRWHLQSWYPATREKALAAAGRDLAGGRRGRCGPAWLLWFVAAELRRCGDDCSHGCGRTHELPGGQPEDYVPIAAAFKLSAKALPISGHPSVAGKTMGAPAGETQTTLPAVRFRGRTQGHGIPSHGHAHDTAGTGAVAASSGLLGSGTLSDTLGVRRRRPEASEESS